MVIIIGAENKIVVRMFIPQPYRNVSEVVAEEVDALTGVEFSVVHEI